MAVDPDHAPRPAAPELLLPPIVLVEDDRVSAKIIRRHLREMRLANPVIEIGDGEEAVGLLEAMASRGKLPSLVLLDQELPGRRGLDVLQWLSADPVLRQVPVVMLSAHSAAEHVTSAHRYGARCYLVKPVGFEGLSSVLRRIECGWALLPPQVSS